MIWQNVQLNIYYLLWIKWDTIINALYEIIERSPDILPEAWMKSGESLLPDNRQNDRLFNKSLK